MSELSAVAAPASLRGVDDLTNRERELLRLMALGYSNARIGTELWLSPRTVESHVGNIFLKLGLAPTPDVHRRVMAVLIYLRASMPADVPLAA